MSQCPPEQWLEDFLFSDSPAAKLFFRYLVEDVVGEEQLPWRAWRQLEIPGAGRADVVIHITDRPCLIVLELKRVADENSIGQVCRYSGALKIASPIEEEARVIPVVAAFSVTPFAEMAATSAGVHLVTVVPGIFRLRSPSQFNSLTGGEVDIPGELSGFRDQLAQRFHRSVKALATDKSLAATIDAERKVDA